MELSGSYRRFGANDSFPSSRVPNNNLSRILQDEAELTTHSRNIDPLEERSSNKFARVNQPLDDFDRPQNVNLNNDGMVGGTGGSFLNGNHWRLKRDPTWYPGRGKQRAMDVLGSVAKIADGVGKVAAAVG
tara:strand:+ start:15238 stop:15630 length:393 start_codon:yes stop_codon:yes gene_type:complete